VDFPTPGAPENPNLIAELRGLFFARAENKLETSNWSVGSRDSRRVMARDRTCRSPFWIDLAIVGISPVVMEVICRIIDLHNSMNVSTGVCSA
jgi:hypothetical protein